MALFSLVLALVLALEPNPAGRTLRKTRGRATMSREGAMGKKTGKCAICGKKLNKEEREGGLCFDCAITYHGGAAHRMAEGIREKRRREQEEKDRPPD